MTVNLQSVEFANTATISVDVPPAAATETKVIVVLFLSTEALTQDFALAMPVKYDITPPASVVFAEVKGNPETTIVLPVPKVLTVIFPTTVTLFPTFVYVPDCEVYVVFPPNVGVQVPSS